jgi:DNA-binding NtrC family response regulator
MLSILFIDDDGREQEIIRQALPNYSFHAAYNAREARELLEHRCFSAILLDLHLPDTNGLVLLEQLRGYHPLPPVIILSAYGSTVNVVRAMRAGAVDFIPKPYGLQQLRRALAEAVCRSAAQTDTVGDGGGDQQPRSLCIGSSPAAEQLRGLLRLYAESCASVLLVGESGSGKEVAARELHRLSGRTRGPFLAINCGAIPPTLIEAELYGTVEGVYTGAASRSGYFEQAHGGTLFMDEIGEMPLPSQVKLLRIIENKRLTRLGGRRQIETDVRIVAATNRNLGELVQGGMFRRDLYHRLNILNLTVPPLRRRKEDIPELVRHFLSAFGAPRTKIERRALMKLLDYHWPGNIRELKNTIERALVLCRGGEIELRHIVLGEGLFPSPEEGKEDGEGFIPGVEN